MSNLPDIRWQQRFENFQKALDELDLACRHKTYSRLERAGVIQLFEVCFELAWKTIKDLLFFEGIEANSPRESIKESFVAGYLSERQTEILLDVLNKRNSFAHTYDEDVLQEGIELIKENYLSVLLALRKTLKEKQ